MKKRRHFEKFERLIIEMLSDRREKGLSFDGIFHALPFESISTRELKAYFSRMVDAKKIIRQKNRFFINPDPAPLQVRSRGRNTLIEGVVAVYKGGQLIVKSEKLPEPILIFPENSRHAIPGDLVQIMLLQKRTKKHQTGRIIRIKKREGRPFLLKLENDDFITRPAFSLPVVLEQNSLKPEKGIWYHARILSDIHPEQYNCTLEKAVDMQKDLDVLDLVQRYSLPQDFPADCIAESGKEPPDNWQRIDLSDLRSYTIDGADAKDFDDAISLKKTADGFTLWVHITDVSHYVVPGSALDKEAFRRGTSVYFPKEVIPMLPEKLSNELCSLKPGEPRKTVSCEMHFNPQGKMQKAFVYPSILKSHKRFTYDEVQDILDGKLPGPFAEELQQCLELSKLLSSHKYHDGAIDFEFPEIKITLADDATVEKLELEPRLDAHRIVEEFMLAANEAVACFCAEINLGTIFRHQPPPGEQDINELDGILKTVKLSIPAGRERFKPKTYQKLVNSLTPDIKDFIQPLVLRSMRQAVYSEKHCTHFGLAKDYYCHFTSPIRRYPDLVVHRQLLNCLAENGLKFPYCIYPLQKEHRELKKPPLQNAREQAVFSSMTERRAVEVEREYQHRKKALFAETRLGQTFSARITGMLASGMFLEIADFPVEGFLPFESLSDYWDFNEKMMYAEKRRRNAKNNEESPVKTNVLRLGDMLSVTIHSIDREKYRVNLRAAG